MASSVTGTVQTDTSEATPTKNNKVFREIERPSASLCDIDTNDSALIQCDPETKRWIETKNDKDDGKSEGEGEGGVKPTPVVRMETGTTVRVSPMEWKCNGWAEEHFHEKLKLPDGTTVGRGLVVTVEAMARECVAISLSPTPYFEFGKTYAVHFGASCNLQTVIRRRIPSENTADDGEHEMPSDEAVDVTVPTPQICTPHLFSSYWIALHDRGKLSVGLGNVPGVDCVATLDDTLYHALRSGMDAVRYVGVGNSALGRNARSLKVRNLRLMPLPECFGDANGGGDTSIRLTDWTIMSRTKLNGDGMVDEEGNDIAATPPPEHTGTTGKDASLWVEYQQQCYKSKLRAEKFGTEYRQPPPDAFFKWSEARRLRANPERGFVTGLDILSVEEREKARKRKERFEEEDIQFGVVEGGAGGAVKVTNGDNRTQASGVGGPDDMETQHSGDGATVYSEWDASTIATYGTNYEKQNQVLPMKQAWDHFDLVKRYRVDPPGRLQPITSYSSTATPAGEKLEEDDTKMAADSTADAASMTEVSTSDEKGEDGAPTPVMEKIHMFAIDWAAFKQIRTDDIMAYFADYGPSYVEWLGELSCNVLFEDKYTSSRAIEAMSRPIPHPKEIFQVEDMFDTTAVVKEMDDDATAVADANIKQEQQQKSATITPTQQQQIDNEEDDERLEDELAVDLGSMGWRFCNRPIRKIQSNRFGRKGTRSRCLMRVETSLDVLEDRPTSWPRPPPGFTTMRVLGPSSDDVIPRGNGKQGNKRRKRNRRSRNRNNNNGEYGGDDEMMYGDSEDGEDIEDDDETLDRGLKSSRPGFTVEEMEAERKIKAENN